MKTNYRIAVALFLAVAIFIFIDGINNFSLSNNSGAPAGRTGSPGDGGLTCAIGGCHSPGPAPSVMAGWITSNVPASGYVPGSTYTITATATRPGHVEFGFEISPQSITGTLLGTLIITNTVETQLVGVGKYVTHKLAGTSGPGGTKTWNFNWTAPAAGTGNVTFYGAFNVTNNNNNSLGDTIYTSTLLISECAVPAQPAAITGKTPVCAGSSQSYSISAVAGATSYTWTLPSGWSGTSTTNSISVTAGTTSGNITVTANNACGASPVRVLAVTTNNVAVSLSPINVMCFGFNNGSAAASPSGGSGPYSFLWSNAATSSAITNVAAGTYTVTVTDAIGCTKTASVTITQPNPLTGCGSANTSICLGDTAILVCSPTSGGTPPYSYLWTPSTGLSSDVIPSPMAFPSSTTLYTIVVTDGNGCTVSSTVLITVNPVPPLPVITQSGDTLFANSTGDFFQWYLNGVPIGPPPFGNFHVTTTPGNYNVIVTTIEGCTSSSAPYPYFPTGVENLKENMMSIYPNPANGYLFIDVTEEPNNHFIDIFDITGHLLLHKQVVTGINQLDISSLDKGIYSLSWQTDKGKFAQRFAIMR